MPVRSDLFQRLVAAMHREVGPGWSVSESRMLMDSRTGDESEVDVVLEALVAGYPVFISVEVRDRRRPADVSWVDTMNQKHADLPTNKLVLWSSAGLSARAKRKAKSTRHRDDCSGWYRGRSVGDLGTRVGWKLRQVCTTGIRSRGRCLPRRRIGCSVGGVRGNGTQQKDGQAQISVGAVLKWMASSPEVRTTLLDHAPEGSGDFHVIYRPPFPCEVAGPTARHGSGSGTGLDDRVRRRRRTGPPLPPQRRRTPRHPPPLKLPPARRRFS
jgi:hypothetical protein